MAPIRVVIIGHSFIRRLQDFIARNTENDNLRLYSHLFDVQFLSEGGLTVDRMARGPKFTTFDPPPQIVFLQIGGNDLDNTHLAAETLVRKIQSYVNYLVLGCGVRHVVIGQILRRNRRGDYNSRVVEANCCLKNWASSLDNITFHHHHGFWKDLSFLSADGVHIRCSRTDSSQMRKYLQSVKRAVLRASRSIW
ncbi:uncharacterized protein LOC134254668 [Saccostrea cucullata]|uniref:uncharacterized protein LOC134254668 n=1 Tax=Saccostrea cuccullata TaxID=36930 RepID=UPI002ECFE662